MLTPPVYEPMSKKICSNDDVLNNFPLQESLDIEDILSGISLDTLAGAIDNNQMASI